MPRVDQIEFSQIPGGSNSDVDPLVPVIEALQRGKGGKDGGQHPRGKTVFLIGAGCSVSAGIWSAEQIVEACLPRLVRQYSNGKELLDDPSEALKWLVDRGKINAPKHGRLGNFYDELFTNHLKSAEEQRRAIEDAVAASRGKINWAHLCLGELVHQRYVHSVVTTNFDSLVLTGIVRTGEIPVTVDGVGSKTRVVSRPTQPQVVHLHGTMHTYQLRNSGYAFEDAAVGIAPLMANLLDGSGALVIVGYSGERHVIDCLKRYCLQHETPVFWLSYDSDIPDHVMTFLGEGQNRRRIIAGDADAVFRRLLEGLGLGKPAWMDDPVQYLRDRAEEIARPKDDDVINVVEGFKTTVGELERCAKTRPSECGENTLPRSVKELLALASDLRLEGDHLSALKLLQSYEDAGSYDVWRMRADSAFELGKSSADSKLLEESITCWNKAIENCSRTDGPLEWARSLHLLGNALFELGQRESGTARLEEAATAYRKSLQERTRQRVPLDWAQTQSGLGNALSVIGEREGNASRLDEALVAYRQALLVYTQEQAPLDWARTQNNLAIALSILGNPERGTTRLQESVEAYRQALVVLNRVEFPLDWAMTQNNLGNALSDLGRRDSGTSRLVEALAAYRQALLIYTRERTPLEWATTQNNLGNALSLLGERERLMGEVGSAKMQFELAVEAYGQALLERSRARVPLDWASTQHNLGATLARIGELEGGTARLEEAVVAFQQALLEQTRDLVPLDWARTQNSLGSTLMRLGERESDTARLEDAVEAYREALLEYTRERVPLDWAMTQNNLGNALTSLGERESGTACLEEAVEAYDAALTVFTKADSSHYVEIATRNRDRALALIAERRGNP